VNAPTKQQVARRYDAWSGWYDKIDTSPAFGGRAQEGWRRRAIELLEAMPGEAIVDLGTGSGLILPWIVDKYPDSRLLGVDISPRMVRVARERTGVRAVPFVGDVDRLPFRDGSVDRLVATYTFTTAPDPRAMLAEAARVLRKGGSLVVLDTGPPPGRRGRLLHAFMRLSAALFGYTRIERRLDEYVEDFPLKRILEERFYRDTVYIVKLERV
jgi:ubiquinone/menaquinone biosynthesis C-methylase UbiE